MTTQKPKYAVLGNLPDDLAQEISTAVEIHPPTSAVEEIDGLFIHGPTATPDLATLAHHLKAGKILTFHQPTDEHLSHMLKLVGYAPASGIPIVSCYRNAATQSSTVFQTLQTTGGIGYHRGSTVSADDTDGTVTLITPAVAPHLTSAQTIVKTGVPPRQGLQPLMPGYTGQKWGTLRVVEALDNGTLQLMNPKMPGPPGEYGPCDANWKYGTNPQPGTALMHYSDYYVYWANGDDGTGNGPYYCLIRVDGGYFTAGKAGGRVQASCGYYNGLFQLYPVTLTVDSSITNYQDWTVTSLRPSPDASPRGSEPNIDDQDSTSSNADGQNPVYVYAPDVSLTFYGRTPSNQGVSWQWNVGQNSSGQPIPVDTLQIPSWGIDYAFDNSIVFHQVDHWNTYLYPWQSTDWIVFWTIYNNPGEGGNYLYKLLAPASSAGRVPFSQVSSWLIKCPGTSTDTNTLPYPTQACVVDMLPSVLADNNPTEAPAGLNTLWHYMAFFAHAQIGCTSNLGPDFHIWFNYFYGCYDPSSTGDKLDLQAIVNHT